MSCVGPQKVWMVGGAGSGWPKPRSSRKAYNIGLREGVSLDSRTHLEPAILMRIICNLRLETYRLQPAA